MQYIFNPLLLHKNSTEMNALRSTTSSCAQSQPTRLQTYLSSLDNRASLSCRNRRRWSWVPILSRRDKGWIGTPLRLHLNIPHPGRRMSDRVAACISVFAEIVECGKERNNKQQTVSISTHPTPITKDRGLKKAEHTAQKPSEQHM